MPFNNRRNSRDDNSKKNRSNSESFRSTSGRQQSSSKNRSDKFGTDRPERRSTERPFDRFEKKDKKSTDRPYNRFESNDRPFKKFEKNEKREGDRSFRKYDNGDRKSGGRPFERDDRERKSFGDSNRFEKSSRPYKKYDEDKGNSRGKTFHPRKKIATAEPKDDGLIRLNRYISNAGICSRRKADELIESGVVSVNGTVVTELGTKVDPAKDEVRYNGERLKREKMVYVLLNKPKDYITTTDDPQERRTVMHLVAKATKERIYPVGRLDRNTTGLLLLTNDGNLAEKLSHPRNNVSKIYNVELNKNLTQGDFNKIQFGIELEDGMIKPDDLSYVQGASKREIGIQIHSGKNRIVRRIFESLGYEIVKLDRVVYANLTKKDLPRGRWRYLEERELIQLKHLIK
ncbi:23S rRNA pseudouridine2605 synthase [Sphingobacterium allocomposti]|uniref:Pseudouridine synthase n=1 Tax=Sphingobacterium allocomposti TaxID=415956 RepID=A0A5S5CY79_9SPHI|nr:pseudouridine synthase [Sphingobacterium composti Yoo et al. 2007 non Ten et al. 2007]TYP88703.1 23S rRNA pseudouridine2605 synthase [Sphingobacterium composti Yoo et al. 2007 non Ten et al. 2007]